MRDERRSKADKWTDLTVLSSVRV